MSGLRRVFTLSCLIIVLLLTLLLNTTVFAQYRWSEDGKPIVRYDQLDLSLNPLKFSEGGHAILLHHQKEFDNTGSSPWLEVQFDQYGNMIDSVRYPDSFQGYNILSWQISSDGGRLLTMLSENQYTFRAVKLDENFEIQWLEANQFPEQQPSNGYSTFLEHEDYTILVHNTGNSGFYIKLLENESGSILESLYYNVGFIREAISRDSENSNILRLAVSSYDDLWVKQIDISQDLQITEIVESEVYAIPTSMHFFGERLAVFCSPRNTTNKVRYAVLLDENGEMTASRNLLAGYYLIKQFRENGFWVYRNDYSNHCMKYYEIDETGMVEVWDSNYTSVKGGIITPDDDLLVYTSTDRLYHILEDGSLDWTYHMVEQPDDCIIIEGSQIYSYTAQVYNFRNLQAVIDYENGSLIEHRRVLDNYDPCNISWSAMEKSNNGSFWLKYRCSNPLTSYVEPASDICQFLRINNQGQIISHYSNSHLGLETLPDNNGGLWILGDSLMRVDSNGNELWEAPIVNEHGVGHGLYSFFASERESAPYPSINWEFTGEDAVLRFIGEDGLPVNDEEFVIDNYLKGHSIGYDASAYTGIHDNRIYQYWRDGTAQDISRFWSFDLETYEQYNFVNHQLGGIVGFTVDDDQVIAIVFADSSLYLRKYDVNGGEAVDNQLLIEQLSHNRQWLYMHTVHTLTSIYADVIFLENSFILVYKTDNAFNWYVEKFDYNGNSLSTAFGLPPVADQNDKRYFLDESSATGFFVHSAEEVFLFDNDINMVEAYEDGILYTIDAQRFGSSKRMVLDNGNFVYAWIDPTETALLVQSLQGFESNSVKDNNTQTTPESFKINNCYPNPFNSSVRINFDVNQTADISLKIFNIYGQEVTELKSSHMTPGNHHVYWDGKDSSGANLASGIYFVSLSGKQFSNTIKILLMK